MQPRLITSRRRAARAGTTRQLEARQGNRGGRGCIQLGIDGGMIENQLQPNLARSRES
jgi:hypothetical protein